MRSTTRARLAMCRGEPSLRQVMAQFSRAGSMAAQALNKVNEPSWSDSQVAEGRPGFFEAQQETAPQEALQAQATGPSV